TSASSASSTLRPFSARIIEPSWSIFAVICCFSSAVGWYGWLLAGRKRAIGTTSPGFPGEGVGKWTTGSLVCETPTAKAMRNSEGTAVRLFIFELQVETTFIIYLAVSCGRPTVDA